MTTLFYIPEESWLKQTRQLWKFWIFVVFLLAAFLLLLLHDFVMTRHYWKYASMCLLAIGFAVLMLLIKCPSCNKRPIFLIIKQTDVNKLTQAILTFSSCPYCGYPKTIGGENTKWEDIPRPTIPINGRQG